VKLSELGEFGFINRIAARFACSDKQVIKGIGDDCAIIESENNMVQLVTTDLLIEGIHFLRDRIPPYFLGRKSLSVNISDIAAMGGRPLYFFMSLAIPKDVDVEYLDAFYEGIKSVADEEKVLLLGGDTTSSPCGLAISIALIGESGRSQYRTRDGAKPGDLICVSGPLGGAAAGLQVLLNHLDVALYPQIMASHYNPKARIAIGRLLAENPGVTAMIDISDGLLQDLGHICRQSGTGAVIRANQTPLLPGISDLAHSLNQDALTWGLTGGEDYELCWTIQPKFADFQDAQLQLFDNNRFFIVGAICEGEGIRILDSNNAAIDMKVRGFDHFSSIPS
jgi:thiamine-monophosphate kinase